MAGERTSLYLSADLAAAVKASGVPLAELIRRGLTASSVPEEPVRAPSAAAAIAITADGEPSPGVACAGPGCWQRNISQFGLRRLPLCPACRAPLEGRTYQREVPEKRNAGNPPWRSVI